MKTTPVKGTNDYLPREAALRDFLQQTILDVYIENGFEHIITPAIEDAENLSKSEGGENLNLIFNILKRGDKLDKVIDAGVTHEKEKDLYDLGLRYDLTLPLSRYYANNQNTLLLPMKCIQIDKVYRAERPQKGRLREFIQCDIDIIGSESSDSEVELILTTAKALSAIGLRNFKIKINDRRLLHAVLADVGFKSEDMDSVCISFDKMDKVGVDGVCEELLGKGFNQDTVAGFKDLLSGEEINLAYLKSKLSDTSAVDSLENIIKTVEEVSEGKVEVVFDISLVRGQGYYTGTVFEVVSSDFSGSVGGGGRYDKLIGKFIGKDVPAVGFSIGFERIFSILTEGGLDIADDKRRIALIYDELDFVKALKEADKLRAEGLIVSLYQKPKKLGKFIDRLEENGFKGFWLVSEKEAPEFFSAK